MATATFGAGCFWGVEAAFRRLPGVISTAVGYAGGATEKPSYEAVCTGKTGHAEVVQIEFDPEKVGFDQLLDVFWAEHDPTQLNRQGPDIGTQYRSAVYFHDAEQEKEAKASLKRLEASGLHRGAIVTEITPASTFWIAEDYHQQYLEKRGLAHCLLP